MRYLVQNKGIDPRLQLQTPSHSFLWFLQWASPVAPVHLNKAISPRVGVGGGLEGRGPGQEAGLLRSRQSV